MQHQIFTFALLLLLSTTLTGQEKLKVAGDARIDGVLKLIKGDDNTVIGLNAGPALTTGSDNTFMGEKPGSPLPPAKTMSFWATTPGALMSAALPMYLWEGMLDRRIFLDPEM